MIDLRWLVGLIFTGFAAVLLYLHCPWSAILPAISGVYILGSKLWDELKL